MPANKSSKDAKKDAKSAAAPVEKADKKKNVKAEEKKTKASAVKLDAKPSGDASTTKPEAKKRGGVGKALKAVASATGEALADSTIGRVAGAVGGGLSDAAGIVGSSAAKTVRGAASGIGSAVAGSASFLADNAATRAVGSVGAGIGGAASAAGRGIGRAASGVAGAAGAVGSKTTNFVTGRLDAGELEKLAKLYGIQKEGKVLNLPPAEMPPEIFVSNFSDEIWHALHDFVRSVCLQAPKEDQLLQWCADFFLARIKERATGAEIESITRKLTTDDDALMDATDKVGRVLESEETTRYGSGKGLGNVESRRKAGERFSKIM